MPKRGQGCGRTIQNMQELENQWGHINVIVRDNAQLNLLDSFNTGICLQNKKILQRVPADHRRLLLQI